MTVGFAGNGRGGYNPDEPRDSHGRWVASGSPPAARSSWRHKPLGPLTRAERAVILLRHSYLSLPDRLRKQLAHGDPGMVEDLSELMRLWPRADHLDDDSFHAIHLDGIDPRMARHLRASVMQAATASTSGDMAGASHHLVVAARDIGPHRLPYLLRGAVDTASSIPAGFLTEPEDATGSSGEKSDTTAAASSAPVPGSTPLSPEFFLVPPETRLTPEELDAVKQRLIFLNLQKYDPNSLVDQAKSLFTGGLRDPSKVISDQERAEQAILLRLYKYNVFTPTPEVARLYAMQSSPVGTALYLAANGLGANQQQQDVALDLGALIEGAAAAAVQIGSSRQAIRALNIQPGNQFRIVPAGIRGYVRVVSNAEAKIPWGAGNQPQGLAFEDYRAKELVGRLPVNSAGFGFKTFDFHDQETLTATSTKTLNTSAPTSLSDPNRIAQQLFSYVNDVADFKEHEFMDIELTSADISTRVLELAIPATANEAQLAQINLAAEYAHQRGVIFKLTVVK